MQKGPLLYIAYSSLALIHPGHAILNSSNLPMSCAGCSSSCSNTYSTIMRFCLQQVCIDGDSFISRFHLVHSGHEKWVWVDIDSYIGCKFGWHATLRNLFRGQLSFRLYCRSFLLPSARSVIRICRVGSLGWKNCASYECSWIIVIFHDCSILVRRNWAYYLARFGWIARMFQFKC